MDNEKEKCEYCDLDKYMDGKFSWNSQENDCKEIELGRRDCLVNLYMVAKNNIWYLEPVGETEDFIKINYCPFCGRKLEEEDILTRIDEKDKNLLDLEKIEKSSQKTKLN